MVSKTAKRQTRSSSRKRGSKKKRAKKTVAQTQRQKEVLGVLLMVLALFAGVALLPLGLFGAGAQEWFPSGNPMGLLGGTLKALLVSVLGAGAVAVPMAVAGIGAWSAGWLPTEKLRRLAILSGGALLILPFAAALAGGDLATSGLLGAAMAEPTVAVLGWLGSWLVGAAAVVLVSVLAFSVNPLTLAGAGAAAVTRRAARAGRVAVAGMRSWWVDWSHRRKSRRAALEHGPERPRREPFDGAVANREAEAVTEGGSDEADEVAVLSDGSATAEGLLPEDHVPGPGHPLPPVGFLTAPARENRAGMERELERLGGVLVEKLQTFNVDCEIGGRTTGPVVTQYEVVPAPGVKVNRIANLDADLALAMKARSIRIVAPIPGKGAVGVEIPNPEPEVVRLREILEARAFARSRGALPLALGKDLTGGAFVSDLTRMPHALIAGATGSGKSVCLNTIITSLVYKHGPDRLRLLLIDPKMVELSAYSDLPHLRHPVVTDPRDAAGVLKWAVLEMGRRYALLSANGVRSLAEFNQRAETGVVLRRAAPEGPEGDEDRWIYSDGPLPYIVVVVDELADLMMTVQAEVERPLTQLAQKARAIGIHLIVATQRPSVNVITGLIKANFPCRIAFRVASKTDSRTILDQNGADSLLGHGDMLFLPPGQSEPVRMQGAFISTEETEALMDWYREQADTLAALKARVQ
ncbi:MAG: DNA translocase FtsK, partial [Gemmatimonadota bacterium]|nr:DNA translocase FtsK [Gemmatimonadota bacterium]